MKTDAGIAMPIVDAQVHIWSQGTPSRQHRQNRLRHKGGKTLC
jgi:hypothetical protein